MNSKTHCLRCLLEDFAPEEYLEHMRTYLHGLSEESKTDETQYQNRLKSCTECDNLYEGLCRLCGCYVEYRAAMKAKHCPGLPPKW